MMRAFGAAAAAALCAALTPAMVAHAAADAAASAMGEAMFLLPTDIALSTNLIGIADQNVPTHSDSKTFDNESTKDGARETHHSTLRETYTIAAGHVTADVEVIATTTVTNVGTGAVLEKKSSNGQGHFDINACPDANGLALGHVKFAFQANTTRAGGSQAGGVATVEGPIRLIDGDDAHLIRTEMDMQQMADIAGYDSGKPFESSVNQSLPMTWNAGGSLVLNQSGFKSQSTGDADKYQPENSLHAIQLFFLMLTNDIAKETEKFWRSGKCIELKPSERSRKVAQQEKISITVNAVHKIDGQDVKAPVKADLTGVKSIDPSAKPIDLPAKFDYVAGDAPDDKGSIAFLQVGRRGIGKETVEFQVKCRNLVLQYEGTLTMTGMGHNWQGRLELAPTPLKCDEEDDMYHATGSMTVKGVDLFHGSNGNCNEPDDYVESVSIVAQIDETDPSLARVGITPAIFVPMSAVSCDAWAGVRHVHTQSITAAFGPLGVDLWGRMLSNRAVTIGQSKVVSDSIAQGAGRATTTTTIVISTPLR